MTSPNRPHIPYSPEHSRAQALEVHYRAEGELSPGSVMDLGLGRLQLTGETEFPVGTELELCFGHSPRRPSGVVTMKASVQRSQPGQMAIRFVSVRPSDHSKVFSTIRQLAASKT